MQHLSDLRICEIDFQIFVQFGTEFQTILWKQIATQFNNTHGIVRNRFAIKVQMHL